MRQCYLCQKTYNISITRKKLRATKFNPTGKKKQKANLQLTKLPNGKKAKVCAKCLKTLHKEK